MATTPAGTKFNAISPSTDTDKRSALINTDYQKVYTLEDIQQTNRYVANLTQTGTAAPVATVLANGLDKTVTWTRTSEGVYTGTCSANWGGTVAAHIKQFGNSSTSSVAITSITANTIVVTTETDSSGWAVADAILAATTIWIEVYPA